MSSEDPQMGGGGMGRPEMAGKWRNPATHSVGCCRVRRPDPGTSAAVGHEISRR